MAEFFGFLILTSTLFTGAKFQTPSSYPGSTITFVTQTGTSAAPPIMSHGTCTRTAVLRAPALNAVDLHPNLTFVKIPTSFIDPYLLQFVRRRKEEMNTIPIYYKITLCLYMHKTCYLRYHTRVWTYHFLTICNYI